MHDSISIGFVCHICGPTSLRNLRRSLRNIFVNETRPRCQLRLEVSEPIGAKTLPMTHAALFLFGSAIVPSYCEMLTY